MASKKTKKKATYTYKYLDGQSAEIEVGKNGVTKELLNFLNESDKEMELQERYQERHESFSYRVYLKNYVRNPDNSRDNPLNEIPDKHADIMGILFPEDEQISPEMAKMKQIMEMLTENQRDLIWEAYGLQKGDTEIAQEQHVTREAIQNRRKKIMKRVEKLLKEVMNQNP